MKTSRVTEISLISNKRRVESKRARESDLRHNLIGWWPILLHCLGFTSRKSLLCLTELLSYCLWITGIIIMIFNNICYLYFTGFQIADIKQSPPLQLKGQYLVSSQSRCLPMLLIEPWEYCNFISHIVFTSWLPYTAVK